MSHAARFLMAAAALVLTLQGNAPAHAGGQSRQAPYVSVTEQRSALVACKDELGRRGWPRFQASYVEYPWGGQTTLRILPYRNVSANDAAWINSCADKALGRKTGPVMEIRRKASAGGCPRNAPVLYRGAGYCIRR
ncbi:MAG: hypothetical protein ACQEVT_05935 [Pseudomonadota bacterium]|uniref:hypothetical protein n=1 Tax=Roseovarius TaxID=74030 RepID=UPI0022A782B7|nr:hypothetical protein [Roseovarius sp. EGI FJ00037]MCZ0810735.1 hypothetical protein [Roseovarius sp. EGI FJ00037]